MRRVVAWIAAAAMAATGPWLAQAEDPDRAAGVSEPGAGNPPMPADPPPEGEPLPEEGELPPDEDPPADPEEERRRREEEAAKKEAAALEKKVKEFKAAMKKATDDERIRLLTDIAAVQHLEVAKELTNWIKKEVAPGVRATAIEAIKSQPFPEVTQAALKNLDANIKDVAYSRQMIGILARVKDPKAIPRLRAIMKDEGMSLELAREAVIALGAIGHRDAIPDLIALYKQFESKFYPEKKHARKEALEPLVSQALRDITKVDQKDSRMWDLWWKENQKTFQMEPKEPE